MAEASGARALTAAVLALVLGAGLLTLVVRHDATAVPAIPTSVRPLALTGDFGAADPCALLDTTVMSRYGSASIGPGNDVGECRLTNGVREAGLPPTVTEVHYGDIRSEKGSVSGAEQDLGGIRIRRHGATSTGCSSSILFGGKDVVGITTRLAVGGIGTNSCEIHEAAVAVATERLAEQGVTYAPAWQADISLARYDACALAADTAGSLPGIEDERIGYPNGSACLVGDTAPGAPYAHISLGLVPEGGMSRHGQVRRTGGTTTYTRQARPDNANGPACAVDLVHLPPSGGPASRPVEYLAVQVEGAAPYDLRCRQAFSIARAMELEISRLRG